MSDLLDQWSQEVRRLSYQANRPLDRAAVEVNFGLICLVLLGVLALAAALMAPGADWTDFFAGP
jgi:4-hydroxybenzoate polyprenyltransferase